MCLKFRGKAGVGEINLELLASVQYLQLWDRLVLFREQM